MKAAVLCPGPSLHAWILSGKLPSAFTVAVTDALFAEVPLDAWAFGEEPKARGGYRYKRYARYLPRVKEIFGAPGHEEMWARWEIGTPVICHTRIEETVPWRGGKGRWPVASTFRALSVLLARGYEEISLFGCDMQGEGNYDPRTGEPLEGTGGEKGRWESERSILERLQKEAGEHGIRIERALLPDLLVS